MQKYGISDKSTSSYSEARELWKNWNFKNYRTWKYLKSFENLLEVIGKFT